MPKRKRIRKDDNMEDILLDKSAYGEFVSTFHAWTGLEGTHKRGAELQDKGKTKIRTPESAGQNQNKEE